MDDLLLNLMANPYNTKRKKNYNKIDYLKMYLIDRYEERDERIIRYVESCIDKIIVECVLNDIIDRINDC